MKNNSNKKVGLRIIVIGLITISCSWMISLYIGLFIGLFEVQRYFLLLNGLMISGIIICFFGIAVIIYGIKKKRNKTKTYKKMKQEKSPDLFVCGQIYGLIMGYPGIYFSEIKRTLKLDNKPLAYHLSYLEKEGYIKSKLSNQRKLFFSAN